LLQPLASPVGLNLCTHQGCTYCKAIRALPALLRTPTLALVSSTASRQSSDVGLLRFSMEHLLVPLSGLSAFSGQVQLNPRQKA
jgi:hypothetical protein